MSFGPPLPGKIPLPRLVNNSSPLVMPLGFALLTLLQLSRPVQQVPIILKKIGQFFCNTYAPKYFDQCEEKNVCL